MGSGLVLATTESGVQHREPGEGHRQQHEGPQARIRLRQRRVEGEPRQQRGPQPQDDDGSTGSVAERDQSVVKVSTIRRGQTLAIDRSTQDREHHVHDRYAKHEQRDEDRRDALELLQIALSQLRPSAE